MPRKVKHKCKDCAHCTAKGASLDVGICKAPIPAWAGISRRNCFNVDVVVLEGSTDCECFQLHVVLEDVAHEIWAAAQLLPGEGIVDGVDRIKDLLRVKATGKEQAHDN